jgi:hypothetical protein
MPPVSYRRKPQSPLVLDPVLAEAERPSFFRTFFKSADKTRANPVASAPSPRVPDFLSHIGTER